MKTRRKTATKRSLKSHIAHQPAKRQRRQQSAVTAVAVSRLNSREFKRLQSMVLWLRERRSYRWISKYTGRGHGWWQQVGVGHSRRVAPNHADLTNVQRLFEIMQADQSIDSEALTLLLEVVEARSQMDMALTQLISLIRKRAGQSITLPIQASQDAGIAPTVRKVKG